MSFCMSKIPAASKAYDSGKPKQMTAPAMVYKGNEGVVRILEWSGGACVDGLPLEKTKCYSKHYRMWMIWRF